MLSVPHLDREFDYLVSAEQSDDAQPGVRVRVRFHGRLVDGFVLERRNDTEHFGKLGWLDRVVSAQPVLTAEVRRLVDAVVARYAGTRPDVLRLAVPTRHARVERETLAIPVSPLPLIPGPVDPSGWEVYGRGGQFLTALAESRAARAVWQALPGEQWADRFAEAAAQAIRAGRAALAIVPDQRDLDVLWRAVTTRVDERSVVALSAGLGQAVRYQRWLKVLRGSARLVIGTRSAVFAPVNDLGLVMVWSDADDMLAEPRAPYPHAREVAMLRAYQARCAALIGGYTRTAEAHALVRSGWAHDVVAARSVVRARAPRVVALDDSGYAEESDPAARTARLPSIALRAARSALAAGAPVLVQVPRRGYVPSLACGRCRTLARCRHCTGPLSLLDRATPGTVCCWCGRADLTLRCARCGSEVVRAVVVGARRTAEELGRAFAGMPVITSVGDTIVPEVGARPALVVATPGAEPRAPGGYGAALLLDTWALLGRQDLRAAEEALWRWMTAAALVRARGDGGVVMVVAEASIPTVQSLMRWDPASHAEAELAARTEVGLPPSVHIAAVDGTTGAVNELLQEARLPDEADLLGPVDLPQGVRRPAGTPLGAPISRLLVRVPREQGWQLAASLRRGIGVLSVRQTHQLVRVQIDPLHIG
ncbi:primosome assembly protein PriA [Mycobacterium leprae Kyoto-2]|uniref:Probable replication restart protein PriA n=3 Tax=Mycobacterium leprae TaxID=1769 RepID=PRIA_MYCLE|nr:primosomal protein N' [Mycobacterium leprae]Q9CCQ3.1 RecName: Full=Probable primosomal protein N'; AltName: Full=ATP-dependent helicase PriA [Mycobacterium leprae TN]CAR70641.1 putative primosomal protein N' [Mycobacterium leprae Br4923]AWV48957.1 primosomal protein N' [Mycobacterium leprae]OAR20255.1 primosome assembly protein PriA [Mycobacterium leprae 3125609]OAX71682.1 primosome assembly protein PriA [Mycobacterium leprae 7935681]CAC30056.1 putative primosomal protein N' [Mycobacterium